MIYYKYNTLNEFDTTKIGTDVIKMDDGGMMAKGGELTEDQLKLRLELVLDDIKAIKEFIYENGLSEIFQRPTKHADECWTHFNNIEIACDLNDDESLSWGKFYKENGGMMAKGGKVDYGSLYKKIVEAVERKLKISDEDAINLVDENEAFIIDMIEHEEIKNPNQIADAIISDYGEANEEMAKGGRVKRKRWIQDALSGNKGELRKTAKRKGLIKGDEKLSKSDLHKLEKMGGKTSRRAHLAETLIDFKK